ncbi:hypothetical protein [Maribacter halichondriae]|uniref:hypothetical protein n=1 Tax=Maribacter halichondriae TaxID=2980554 RepID=UPI002359C8A0|nr:hypothetical protein [Maribacter sp. Hal144]
MKKIFILSILILMGCSSAELVDNWKDPDIVIFYANKVLLVGMTQNEEARTDFESRLKSEFDQRGIEAMRSIDLFDVAFTNTKRTEKELDDVERSLLDKDFDAILLTKITGSENRQSFRQSVAKWNNQNNRFRDDYLRHQDIYYDDEYYENFTVYHAETSLYCICEGKERALIWRGNIEITDPNNIAKTVNDYVKLVVVAMEEQDLIFHKEEKDEVTGL